MYRVAIAVVVLLAGCATSPAGRSTCDMLAEASQLDVQRLQRSPPDKARWLAEVGLSNEHYRSIYWYQNDRNERLVCLYTAKCRAEVHAYRRDNSQWVPIETPGAGLTCITDA